jgi:hypothetical protein
LRARARYGDMRWRLREQPQHQSLDPREVSAIYRTSALALFIIHCCRGA